MIEMKLRYSTVDEPDTLIDTRATAPDLIAFEREYKVTLASLGGAIQTEYLAWLAWHSARRRPATRDAAAEDYATFLEQLEDLELEGDTTCPVCGAEDGICGRDGGGPWAHIAPEQLQRLEARRSGGTPAASAPPG